MKKVPEDLLSTLCASIIGFRRLGNLSLTHLSKFQHGPEGKMIRSALRESLNINRRTIDQLRLYPQLADYLLNKNFHIPDPPEGDDASPFDNQIVAHAKYLLNPLESKEEIAEEDQRAEFQKDKNSETKRIKKPNRSSQYQVLSSLRYRGTNHISSPHSYPTPSPFR